VVSCDRPRLEEGSALNCCWRDSVNASMAGCVGSNNLASGIYAVRHIKVECVLGTNSKREKIIISHGSTIQYMKGSVGEKRTYLYSASMTTFTPLSSALVHILTRSEWSSRSARTSSLVRGEGGFWIPDGGPGLYEEEEYKTSKSVGRAQPGKGIWEKVGGRGGRE
jgi:hypothetical protein